jgi:hypothetical protein
VWLVGYNVLCLSLGGLSNVIAAISLAIISDACSFVNGVGCGYLRLVWNGVILLGFKPRTLAVRLSCYVWTPAGTVGCN